MPSVPTSNAGIVTDENSGERHIPESQRADGTTRRAIKIRPGYRPPEDVQVYKNRTAEAFRERGKKMGIPGTAGLKEATPEPQASSTSNKNAKRREARRKAKGNGGEDEDEGVEDTRESAKAEEVDPQAEKEKKARNIKKKLKQAKDLQSKKEGGEALLPEQIAKMMKINELVRELELLGFDEEEEPKESVGESTKSDSVKP